MQVAIWGSPRDQPISITREDRDLIRLTGSRLACGARLSREALPRLALLASENRAANALALCRRHHRPA